MEGFMLYTAQYPAIKTMTQEQKGDLLDALYAYAIDGAQMKRQRHLRMRIGQYQNKDTITSFKQSGMKATLQEQK